MYVDVLYQLIFFYCQLIHRILKTKPGGDDVLKEYQKHNSFKDKTRRLLVNIVVGHMMEGHG